MSNRQENNYFKGFRKSPKQLLESLKKDLKIFITSVRGYADTCEYHLELEKCKSADDFADVQCICEELGNHLEYVGNILDEDGLQADISPEELYGDNCPEVENFDESIDWTKGLMLKLKEGLEKGMWFQRLGMKFFVPPENINAYFDSTLGIVEIYFHSDDPCTIATYSIMSYKRRWALREEDLEDIYVEVEKPSEEAIKRNEERLVAARKVFK